jgi:hypothetical protein
MELGICLGAAALVGVVVELEKAWRRQRAANLVTEPEAP